MNELSHASRLNAVLDAESRRRSAMICGDLAELEALLSDSAIYIHTNGLRETKTEYLNALKNRSYHYMSVEQPELSIRLIGDVAIATGRTVLKVALLNGLEKLVDARSVVIWSYERGHWRMELYQGTTNPTAAESKEL